MNLYLINFHTQAVVLWKLYKCYYICKNMNAINKQWIYSMLRLNYNRLCRLNWFMYTHLIVLYLESIKQLVSSHVLAVTKAEEHCIGIRGLALPIRLVHSAWSSLLLFRVQNLDQRKDSCVKWMYIILAVVINIRYGVVKTITLFTFNLCKIDHLVLKVQALVLKHLYKQ